MNAIDILGSLLGHKQTSGGKGGDVLADIFGRRPAPTSRAQPTSIDQKAKELEDLLNVAKDRQSAPAGSPPSEPTAQSNDQALILIRAMVNAAKADGRLDATEQEKIIKQLRSPSRETLEFLRGEFAKSESARDFAMTVPVGMEQQVYTMSLIAIDLDTGAEAKYLMELADTLRLPNDVRDQIHERLGAPSMF